VKVGKLGVILLMVVTMFGVIPCVYAQDDDPCARFSDINVQTMCRTMLFGGNGQEGLIDFKNEFIKKYFIPDEELPTGSSSPSISTDRSQILKYAFPSAPSAESESGDQSAQQSQPQKSNTDNKTERRNIFR
jgi:hypothetical protein